MFFPIDLIQYLLFTLMKRMLPIPSIKDVNFSFFETLQMFLMLDVLLTANETFIIVLDIHIVLKSINVIAVNESFSWNMLFFF